MKLVIREVNLTGGRTGHTIRKDMGNGLTIATNGKTYKTKARALEVMEAMQ